jgi:hypothetical protein
MTRTDEKYICRISQLPEILEKARPDFQVLEHTGKRVLNYETCYLDTMAHDMFLMHHNGKLNRYKIRFRKYVDSQDVYFEIKYKDNRRMTTKQRIPAGPDFDFHTDAIRSFMAGRTCYTPDQLEPVLTSSFQRITLVNTGLQERITIDINPAWQTGNRRINLPSVAILEVKSVRTINSAGFGYLLREARIMPLRISKYCIGTSLLFPEIKHNRFKSKLLLLKKLE